MTINYNEKYIIKKPLSNNNQTEMWADEYIPFEPKGLHMQMRNDLRYAIREMVRETEGVLYASYVSDSDKFCDAENVLFYNIGTSVFTPLCKNGICFERGFGKVRADGENIKPHYYHYSQGSNSRLWQEKEVLAVWKNVNMVSTPTSNSKPYLFWQSLKSGEMTCTPKKVCENHGLSVSLNVPEKAWCNLSTLMKPLLDGIISVFHQHKGRLDDDTLSRLSNVTALDKGKLEHLLCESRTAALGDRTVISAYRDGIKWNPEDDKCVMAKIMINRIEQQSEWSFSGKLFTITEKN